MTNIIALPATVTATPRVPRASVSHRAIAAVSVRAARSFARVAEALCVLAIVAPLAWYGGLGLWLLGQELADLLQLLVEALWTSLTSTTRFAGPQ